MAERIVERYLTLKGATMVRRNYRGVGFEIDLIMACDTTLIAVEVKLRRSIAKDLAFAESLRIDRRKIARIKRGLETIPGEYRTRRIDLAVVDLKKNGTLELGAYYINISIE